MESTKFKPFVIAKEVKGKLRTMVVNGEVYYSLLDIGHAIGIGNPHETKRYLDDKEISFCFMRIANPYSVSNI